MTRRKVGKYVEQVEHVCGKKYVTVYNQKTEEIVIIRRIA